MAQLEGLVDTGNTVIVDGHDMRVVAQSDCVMDIGPGAGATGGCVVAEGIPAQFAKAKGSRSAPFLLACLEETARADS